MVAQVVVMVGGARSGMMRMPMVVLGVITEIFTEF